MFWHKVLSEKEYHSERFKIFFRCVVALKRTYKMGLKDRDYYWEEREKKSKSRSVSNGPPDLMSFIARHKSKLTIIGFSVWATVLLYLFLN